MDIQQAQLNAQNLTDKEVEFIIQNILSTYSDAAEVLKSKLDKIYADILQGVSPKDYYKTMLSYSRLDNLIQYCMEQYSNYSDIINKEIAIASSLSLTNNWYRSIYLNSFMAGTSFSILDKRIIELSVFGTKESWKAINDSLQGKYMSVGDMAPQYGSLVESILDPFKREVLTDIQKIITTGFVTGSSVRNMASSISDLMSNASWQAERIARTESSRTANEAIQLSSIDAKNQGVNIKRMWVSSHDNRVRPRHSGLDGQLAPVDKPFVKNGITVMRPGAWPDVGDNINERCRTVNVVIGEDGTPDLPKFRRGYPPVNSESEAGKSEVYSMKYFDQWAKENGLKYNKYGQMYAA